MGEEASFLRSATEISNLISLVSGFGGKQVNRTPIEIYPQLMQLEDLNADPEWVGMPMVMKEKLIAAGVFDKNGVKITKGG